MTTYTSADCVVYDGHVMIQMLPFPAPEEGSQYRDMSFNFVQFLLGNANKLGHKTFKQIHVEFDRHLPDSIKTQTRQDDGDTSY